MTSYWAKRRSVSRFVRVTEQDILNEYNEMVDIWPKRKHQNSNSPVVTFQHSEPSTSFSECLPPPRSTASHEQGDRLSFDIGTSSLDDDPVDSDSDVDNDEPEQDFLIRSLKYWATTYSVSLVALSALLSILKVFHPTLPKDGRTLLGTQTHVPTIKIEGGEYYHFGLVNGLLSRIKCLSLPVNLTTLLVQFNIDGLPLFKSSKLQFWPIRGLLKCDYTKSPFVVGIFCGISKPNIFEYLQQFVKDLVDIQTNGVVHNGKKCCVLVDSFVCDAPARAFIKNTKSHNGYSGCDKCDQDGVWMNKMTYPETNVRLRTDRSFSDMIDEEHHLKQTLGPLTGIVKMVSMFPLDYMHLCCLGVTRKLLVMWVKGKNLATRIPSKTVSLISRKLLELRSHTPCEFNRKPRALIELDRWKATELQSFMLYWGPIVLKDCLAKELYDKFMLFSVGMYLFLSPAISEEMVAYAQKLMVSFVEHFGNLYGRDEIVFTIHQVIHLADEYRQYGPLDNISGFPFENYLGQIKRLLRKPDHPLQQVVKRLSEIPLVKVPSPIDEPVLHNNHTNGPLPTSLVSATQYSKVNTHLFTLSTKHGDNCVAVGDYIALVENIVQTEGHIFVLYRRFQQQQPYYTYPCESSHMGIFRVSQLHDHIGVTELCFIKHKCVLYPDAGYLIAIPLIHVM
ncbi:hypothetical protein ACEWY4_017078 [Coilia grayii]|uniref:Transposase domain-containing protein n=1 Tax=Coilia grayii TaxID=363190 RepID=A0ABD1JGY3_9TELE